MFLRRRLRCVKNVGTFTNPLIGFPNWGTGMVDDEVQRSAEELRETAARLRLLVQQTRSATTRAELLDLAERFERMAARIDGRNPP